MTAEVPATTDSPEETSKTAAPQSVSSLVVSLSTDVASDGQLSLERELDRLKQENVEVQQLRQAQEQLQQLQEEVKGLKTENKLLQDLNQELESSISALKEGTQSLQNENKSLRDGNEQLQDNINQLDVDVARLKYLRGENADLRKAEESRLSRQKTQLQAAINLRVDLMNASAHVDSILEELNGNDSFDGTELMADTKVEPSPVPSTAPVSPTSPCKEPRSTHPPNNTADFHRREHPHPSRGSGLPSRPDLKSRTSTRKPPPLQNRITPAPTPDPRLLGERDKRRRDSHSPHRGYGYESDSDRERGPHRSYSSRYGVRRRSEADFWP